VYVSAMLMFPKPKKQIKARKPLRRSKKRIATRATFKDFDNGKRCRRRSDAEVMAKAMECRAERLANPTEAEAAMTEILTRLGVRFEREAIFLNGDRWIAADFLIPSVKLVIELDGAGHRLQKRYDAGRSMWLARNHGLSVVRLWNRACFDGTAEQRIMEMLGIKCSSS
jgi:very-short-patch-repair endonuclease